MGQILWGLLWFLTSGSGDSLKDDTASIQSDGDQPPFYMAGQLVPHKQFFFSRNLDFTALGLSFNPFCRFLFPAHVSLGLASIAFDGGTPSPHSHSESL